MNNYRSILMAAIPFLLIHSNSIDKKVFQEDEGIWTGTVTFLEKQTGKETVISEWKMEAKIVNNKGTAVHSFHFKALNGSVSDCKNEEATELSVGIDEEEKKYSIEAPMPGCYGKQTAGSNTTDFAKTDETAISINDQPLKDLNLLEGTISERSGGNENESSTTTYTWRLVRTNKTSKTVSKSNNVRPSSSSVPSNKKELWSGTVTWTKTSSGAARTTATDHGFENVFRWANYMAYHTDVNFINSKGVVYRADTATKWEKDSVIFIHPQNKYMIEERMTKIYRKGKGDFDLKVEFSDDRKTYWVSFFGPICPEFMSFERKNNIHGNTFDSSTKTDAGFQVTLPADGKGYPVGNNPNILSGKFEEIIPPNPTDPASQAIITRAKWELKKVK